MAVVRFPPACGLLAAIVCLSTSIPPLGSADCNENCIEDAEELALQDCNANGIPDDCDLKPPGAVFDRGPVFHPGGSSISLDAVDLDLDGFADVLTADALRSGHGSGVSIFFGDGRGGLEDTSRLVVSQSVPGTLARADFDRDGDLDIAIASVALGGCTPGSNRVSIFRNLGGREFAPALTLGGGLNALDLEAADIDRDGDVDLVTVDAGPRDRPDGGVLLLRNRGDASFDPPEHRGSVAGPARSIAATDLDGNGYVDLAVIHDWLGYVTLLTNRGDGTFDASGTVLAMNPVSDVLAGDLDADGDVDLFVSNLDSGTAVILENPGSVSAWPRSFLHGAGGACMVDMERDGLTDFVAPRDGNLQIFRNTGLLSFVGGNSVYLSGSVRRVTSADMDADGDDDVMALSDLDRERISIVRNRGGELVGPLFIEAASVPLGAGDLDGDGDVDLAEQAFTLRNSGSGVFPQEDWIRHTDAGHLTTALALGDIDEDGDLDLVKGSLSVTDLGILGPGLQVHTNDGAGAFSTGVELFSDAGELFSGIQVSLGDIDGDRDLDIVALVARFQVSLFINEGGGTFLAGERAVAGADALALATGDLDGDGLEDAMIGNRAVLGAANVSVFRSRGDGALIVGRNYAVGSEALWIALGDVDADGDLDAAASGVHILENDGHGALESRRVHQAETTSGILLDLDGDGDLDVAAGNQELLLNDGGGRFDARERSPWTTGGHILGADLDGDGDHDLIEEGITVTWNLGAATFEAPSMTEVPADAHLTGAVDRDADGDLDLTAVSGPFAGFLDLSLGGGFETVRWRQVGPDEILAFALVDLDGKQGLDMVFIGADHHEQGLWRFGLFVLRDGIDPALREEVLDLGIASRDTPFDLDAADLDGDGHTDLTVKRSPCIPDCDSAAFVIRSDGQGNLSPSRLPGDGHPNLPMERLVPVDLDGDGDLDLITEAAVYRNRGGTAFDGPSPFADACCGPAAGDVDGDGDADIVTDTAVLRNGGDGAAFERSFHRGPLRDVSLADVDGDGSLDLVGSARSAFGINLLVNDGKGSFEGSLWLQRNLSRVEFVRDLDGDGKQDIVTREPRDAGFRIHWNRVEGPIRRGEHTDLDLDGRIDACQGNRFRRGDVTRDLQVDISDSIALLRFQFRGDPPFACMEAGDFDNSGTINVTDAILILVYLFQGGPPPPHPPDSPCTPDDDDDTDCLEYPECR